MPDHCREKQGSSLNVEFQISKYLMEKLSGMLQLVPKSV